MYSLKLGPKTVVVLTDRRIVKQLLDKKASSSSNRPVSLVTQQLITEGDHMLLMDNTPRWRVMRKVIHQDLTESVCDTRHERLQQAETIQMLYDLQQKPEEWVSHLKRFSNSIIMSIVYGIRSSSFESPWTKKLNELVELWARINEFGATPPIDAFPFLKWVPERFLGNWMTRARAVHDETHSLYGGLLKSVEERRRTTGGVYCIADRLLDQNEENGLTRHNIMLLAGVALKGGMDINAALSTVTFTDLQSIVTLGSDTTASTLSSFVQAMIAFPEVQRKAHAEIDAIIGDARIPQWSDYNSLPYVATVVKETMRWRPTAPLGFPHALSQDEWVDGKLLPKGTVIFVNVWGLHHDETKFENPNVFEPDRYAGRIGSSSGYANSADYENRDHYGFGNGRRLCPGIHLADRNLWHAISKILWAFEIKPKIDPHTSKPMKLDTSVETGYREGLTMCPYEFPCEIVARSAARSGLVSEALKEAQRDVFPQYERTEHFMQAKA
ncbi:hypothetical protein LTR17_012336 [Elasticomyces elasticus]|nr:hypothetical protein LTR17_012336 [Elasticomyces elasticus]